MLQSIRDKSSGPVAYAIVGLIALVFSVWGIGSYFTESANPAVAEVGGTVITKYQLQNAYNQRYQRLQELLGDSFNAEDFDHQQFRRAVLESLVQKQLLMQYAQDVGYRVTDAGVLAALRHDPRFQVNGQFSTKRYRAILARAGITPAAFEANIRNQQQVAQIRRGILRTAVVSQQGVQRAFALANQERQVAYLAFDPEDYVDQVSVDEAEIKAWYDSHANQFMRPKRIKLAYVLLDQSQLQVSEDPDQAALKNLYQQVKDSRFKTPERRLARHILVQVDADTTAAQARKKIQELAARLNAGGISFAELAREVSDDQATADKGGQLDWVTRGTIVPEFEDVLFSLQVGQVSNPVKTEFGWHLIKLEKIDQAVYQDFQDPEVQAQLESLYRKRARQERYQKLAERLEALSFQTGSSLQPIADQLDLDIQTTGWITQSGGDGIAANEAVVTAAFSPAVLNDGLNSTPIQVSPTRQIVLRIADKQPAQQRPLDEVRARIREQLVKQGAAEIAHAKAQAALQALREGKTLAQVADGGQAKMVEAGWIGRDSEDVPAAVVAAAFALPQPSAEHSASFGKTSKTDGYVAVLRLTGVRTAKADDPQELENIQRRLRNRIAGMEYRAFRQSLRSHYDVSIHEDRL